MFEQATLLMVVAGLYETIRSRRSKSSTRRRSMKIFDPNQVLVDDEQRKRDRRTYYLKRQSRSQFASTACVRSLRDAEARLLLQGVILWRLAAAENHRKDFSMHPELGARSYTDIQTEQLRLLAPTIQRNIYARKTGEQP